MRLTLLSVLAVARSRARGLRTAAPPDAPAGHRELRVDLVALALVRGRRRDRRGPSIKLDSYKASAPLAVPAATIAASTDPSFALPEALGACS